MAEALSQTQLMQQQAEERERLDEEWTAIAEERRLLDEDKKRVTEERRLLVERKRLFEEERRIMLEERRMMEAERSIIEDDKRSITEDRQRMIEEREDIDRIRENALSSMDDSVRTMRRAARKLAEGGTRGLEDRSSSSSTEGRPAKRPRRTPSGPRMRSVSTAAPRSSRNGTDPLGLSTASYEIKNIWRQIEFPQEWTGANSDILFEEFTRCSTRKVLPTNRPLSILDKQATKDSCLITRLRRSAPNLDNGPDHRCSLCISKSRPCIGVDFTMAGPDNEPYDEEGQAKRWKLSIRND